MVAGAVSADMSDDIVLKSLLEGVDDFAAMGLITPRSQRYISLTVPCASANSVDTCVQRFCDWKRCSE